MTFRNIAARWQLAVWPTRASRFPSLDRAFRREVYDLSVDPGETVNLAGELPGTEDFLLDALLDWIASGASGNLTAEQRSGEDLDREVERQLEALGYVE